MCGGNFFFNSNYFISEIILKKILAWKEKSIRLVYLYKEFVDFKFGEKVVPRLIFCLFGISATIHTRQAIQCFPHVEFSLNWPLSQISP